MDYNATSFIPDYNNSNNSFNHNDSYNSTLQNSTRSPDAYPYPEGFFLCNGGKATQFTIILFSIWGILAPLAIYCLYSQVRSDRVVPVFIINLLISDVIQICCMILQLGNIYYSFIKYIFIDYVYYGGVMASVFFMTFIALERYLLIASPFWYRFQRKLKVSASVSVVSWILSVYISLNNVNLLGPLLVLPLPLLIFFFVRSLKALSTSHNVPPDERRQIVAVLTVVLFAYILTFLPHIIIEVWMWGGWLLWYINFTTYRNFFSVSCTITQIKPLTHLLLYILIKKWVLDKLLALLCSCRKTNNGNQQTNSITVTTCSRSASQEQTEAENNF
ncbi:ovarian cancer G-protein coupled receptor 1-like [Poecilia formosa]|uniref:ovarian cancer G-protein coupled receptor 1-like n=1 Tax=Poecilia formosa TaxID=48698 RepID=UPI0007B9C968|nr:PREDICTED: ovarian cancer G-protein coupled receptor 1-like [Poecilia formosa]